MSTSFIPREYSLRPVDLLPEASDSERDETWTDFCREAAAVDREAVLKIVLERLETSDELKTIIDEACTDPHEDPDNPRIPVYQAMRLTKQVGQVVATVVAEQVVMRHVCRDKE